MNHKPKYFIAGGCGFIGSHLVDRLAGTGEVTVYDNLSGGRVGFIKRHLDEGTVRLIQADLLETDRLQAAMKGSDTVFHLAANSEARTGFVNTRFDLEQGPVATCNILEAMRSNGIKK